jgi:aminopeptidase YwaD
MQFFNRFLILFLTVGFISLNNCQSIKIDNPEITTSELADHIGFLASDSLKGRYPGTPEDKVAANYILDHFEAYGLKLLGENGKQYFDVVTSIKPGENNSLQFDGFNGISGKDFTPFPFSGNDTISSTLVFVGYGFEIIQGDLIWNDYANQNVRDKWVLILRGDPELDSLNSIFANYSDDRDKAILARDKGVAGILMVSGIQYDSQDELVSMKSKQSSAGLPVIHITRETANLIIRSSGKTIKELEERLNSIRNPLSFETDVEIVAVTEVLPEKVQTQNVIAILESTDTTFKNEFILIGAHYDHLGFGGTESSSRSPDTIAIHYGADDNASGVSAVIELAEKFASEKENLKRSIIFMAFGAEEMGLLGSKYFINNPLVKPDKIKTMFNIDMVGRLNKEQSLQIGGAGTSLEAKEILNPLSSGRNFKVALSDEGYGPSDHASFYGIDIPVLYFSTGAHLDYHTPNDVIDSINFNGLKSVTDYIYDIVAEVTNRDTYLTFREAGPKTGSSGQGRRKGVTLGIMPDFAGNVKNGLRADFVIPGRPADKGGMKKGDIIVAINGKLVTNIYDYMYRLSSLKAGQTITVEVKRGDKSEVLLIQL